MKNHAGNGFAKWKRSVWALLIAKRYPMVVGRRRVFRNALHKTAEADWLRSADPDDFLARFFSTEQRMEMEDNFHVRSPFMRQLDLY